MDEYLPLFVPNNVQWLLANTDAANSAVEAIEAAICHDVTAETEAGLSHHFSDVVARALKAIATPMALPLPEAVKSLPTTTPFSRPMPTPLKVGSA